MLRRLFATLSLAVLGAGFSGRVARAQIPAAEYAARRDSLAARMGDGVLLALGASEPAHDYEHFWQASPFLYLTGYREPDAALVMVKRNGRVTSTLFVQPKDPAAEVWTGMRTGVEAAPRVTGLAARRYDELRGVLDSLLAGAPRLYVVGDLAGGEGDIDGGGGRLTPDQQTVLALRQAHPRVQVSDAAPVVDRLRGRKSPAELALIRRAVDITVDAHREAMRALEPGMNEFELQALIEYTFRRQGADRPSFATIVGSGANSTTLHYNADDRFMNAGEVVVMDIGASALGYAADVTRTLPVSGTFSPAQREIYQLVRDAQAAAERQAKLGAPSRLMDDSSRAVLAAGLARLGLTEGPTATYDCDEGGQRQCPQLALYYMHSLGHGIGLDVHDPEQFYLTGRIAPGSAFTIEPGIYVRRNLLEIIPDTPRNRAMKGKIRAAVERYRDIGVRIEDDYVATETGVEWISRAPREIDEIEAGMRATNGGPAGRDPKKVEWRRP
ncbi:MAG TPA: Xaa-Pro aminopeptidase [Gemmatimonadaceae bacterium]|nr:Xaa-Pro aminopeptidase [Gemmatimonadaceae bacterium]